MGSGERSASIGTSAKSGTIVVQTRVREDRLTDADPLGSINPLQNLRGLGLAPILTSEGLGWQGIKAERFRHSLREIEQLPFENHSIAHTMGPFRFERHRDGRVDKGYHAPGKVSLIPAGSPAARWILEGEADVLQLSLDPALVEGVAEEIGADGAELLDFVDTCDPLIERLALSLKAELEAGGTALGGRLYAESLANALAVHLLREHSSLGERAKRRARSADRGLPRSALRNALDYIGDNLASDPSLAGMAGAAGLSPNHFSKLFKRSTGLPPRQYVIRQRIEKAKALLAGTDLPVGVVAWDCGFSDQAHLTRHFKRLVGTTPARFRR